MSRLLFLYTSISFFYIRHEKSKHPTFMADDQGQVAMQNIEKEDTEDYIYNYHRSKLAFGLLLFEFEDAVKEGDGDRLLNVYKFALLLYKCYGHHKYAYVIFLYLVKVEAVLSQMQAASLKYNRFYSRSGGKGSNISLDLKMEQLNKLLKTLWRGLGANLNEDSAARVANAIESLECIIESVDKDCVLGGRKGHRSKGKNEDTVQKIVNDLMKKETFNYTPGRNGYPSFPQFPAHLLQSLDYRDLHSWMKGHLEQWEVIYKK
jgi:hypothetical protein